MSVIRILAGGVLIVVLTAGVVWANQFTEEVKQSAVETKDAVKQAGKSFKEEVKKSGRETGDAFKQAGQVIKQDSKQFGTEVKEGFKKSGHDLRDAFKK